MRRPLNLPSDREARGRTLGEEELALLEEVIRSGKLNATGGVMVPRLEEEFARLQGLPHAVALSSGSAAVHTALAALDLEPGDEVITSPVTDMGALAPILWQGAIPVFCDLDPDTLEMTASTLEAKITPRTRAVVVTHLFGLPCPMDEILEAAGSIPVVEDCAQAPLATWKGRMVGTFGALAAYSFQQGKHITCGEGGIVLTSDPALARRARLFANKGWPYGEPSPDHEFLAMNFRMTELQGAVLLGQLPKLEEVVRHRRERARLMDELLQGIPGVEPPVNPGEGEHSYWKYTLRVDPEVVPGGAGALGRILKERGLPAAPHYVGRPAFDLGIFRERRTLGRSRWPWRGARPGPELPREDPRDFPGTYEGLQRALVLPWNERYTTRDVEDMAALVREAAETLMKRGKE